MSARSTDPLDAMAEIIADRVMSKLLARGIVNVAGPKAYTTHKNGPHVPGKTRRWMKDHLKAIAGARKVGRDWEIDVADYDAWAKADDRKTNASRASNDVSSATDDAALRHEAQRALKAAGFRRSK